MSRSQIWERFAAAYGLVLAASGTLLAQLPAPYFDAPVIVRSNNSSSMSDLLDINGDGLWEALCIREDPGSPQTNILVRAEGLQAGTLYLQDFYTVAAATVGGQPPIAGIGRIGPWDLTDDVAFAYGNVLKIYTTSPNYSGAQATLGLPSTITGVAVRDFDGDGQGDVAVLAGNLLSVYRYLAPGAFSQASVALPAFSGISLVALEANGDGVADLAVVGASALLYSVAGSTIQAGPVLPIGVPGPMPVAGDIDGDGDQDLVVFGTSDYVVARRTGPAAFSVEAAHSGGPATHLYDIDGDGDLDGACCGGSGGGNPPVMNQPSTFRISINTGGVFAPAFEIPGFGAYRLAGAADLDLDGDKELIAGRCIYYPDGPLVADPYLPGLPWMAYPQTTVDLDRDGDTDWNAFLTSVSWNLGDGTAAVGPPPLVVPPPPGVSLTGWSWPGDWDGDGDTDFLAETAVAGASVAMRLFLNTGGGSFADAGDAFPQGILFTTWLGVDPTRVLAADADGDGDLDIVARPSLAPWWSHLWLNDGFGHFALGEILAGYAAVHVAEFTGDGRPDMIVSDGRLMLRRGLAGGGFSPPEVLTAVSYPYFNAFTSFNPGSDRIAVADFNLDGRLDIIAGERSATGGCFPAHLVNTGGAAPPFNPSGSVGTLLGVGYQTGAWMWTTDVDVDGRPDFLAKDPFNVREGGLGVALGNAWVPGINSSTALQQVLTAHAFADVDGDGDQDVIGPKIVKNRRFRGPGAGARLQYAPGSGGTGGSVPVLGATGPFRTGQPSSILLANGLGGAPGLLAIGLQPAQTPLLGAMEWLIPLVYLPFSAGGAPSSPGAGSWNWNLGLLPPSFAGTTFYLQAGLADSAGAMGISRTNGLAITVGP